MEFYLAGIIIGLVLIVFAADQFVVGAVAIARNLGISPLVIGLTIVGLGTSAPEMLVSGIASWQGNTGLAVGNALGSNIANIGLILGVTAILAPVTVHSKVLKRELPVLLGVSVVCFFLGSVRGLNFVDSGLMISGLGIFLFWLVKSAKSVPSSDPFNEAIEHELPKSLPLGKAFFWFVIGLLGLILSSRLLVWAAVHIAQSFGVSDLLIGLTIVALGTSLPELAASISCILKGEDDLVLGNIIGSNMYNLLAVYPLPGIFYPGPLASEVLTRDFPWMLGFTVALCVFGFNRYGHGSISRLQGGGLLIAFCVYQLLIISGGQ